ncbi:hypothetical protein, partial [Yersinia intermedia]|uniref:hypothetical protein n=1 Tax=Yersinia intermedia TaxID=631 RepID=UPI001C96AA85
RKISKQNLIANKIINLPTKYILNRLVKLSLTFQKIYNLYLLILLIRKTDQETKYPPYDS